VGFRRVHRNAHSSHWCLQALIGSINQQKLALAKMLGMAYFGFLDV
jgi:hypothetical protein